MALQIKGKSKGGKAKLQKKSLPTKRSINLVGEIEKPINWAIAIPSILLILVCAALISKFAVIDRLVALNKARAEVAAMQTKVEQGYARIDEFGELTELYAHYTFSGMTTDELRRPDRVDVMDLIEKVVMPNADVTDWTVSGTLLTLNISSTTLDEVGRLSKLLQEDERVDYCSVTTASSQETKVVGDETVSVVSVSAKVMVYLKANEEVGRG